ncbi:hypothetical protein ACJX0J_016469, partial [Zea mays]
LFKSVLGFEVDNSTFMEAQIRATFYPKFENDKSDQETRTRMIEMVSHGLANLEGSLGPASAGGRRGCRHTSRASAGGRRGCRPASR